MKLIVTAQGPRPEDPIDPRFGRARYHVLVDEETGSFQALDNTPQIEAVQGAGVQAAQNIVASGARVLLTGRCGPKAFQVLQAAGLEIYAGIQGTVLDAVQAWREGKLTRLEAPDALPHR